MRSICLSLSLLLVVAVAGVRPAHALPNNAATQKTADRGRMRLRLTKPQLRLRVRARALRIRFNNHRANKAKVTKTKTRTKARASQPKARTGLLASLGGLFGKRTKRERVGRVVVVKRSTVSTRAQPLRGVAVRDKVAVEMPGIVPRSQTGLQRVSVNQLIVWPGALGRLERAVEMMHASGIAHGAITLQNLRVDAFGRLYLAGGWKGARTQATPDVIAADRAAFAQLKRQINGS